MSWLRRSGAASPSPPAKEETPAAPPAPRVVEHVAPGLGQAIRQLPKPGGSVLDLGPALATNIAYFNRIGARLRVFDLEETLREAGLWASPLKIGPWSERANAALALSGQESFDLVFAWDFPNLLGRERWLPIAEAVISRLTPHGMIHLMVRSGKEMPAQPSRFRLTAAETIREELQGNESLTAPRFSHAEVERLHPGLAAARSFLDKHGVQEFLLERAERLDLPPRAVAQPRKPRSFYPG